MDLDFMPSPIEDRPGLLIRDPFRYSDATLVVPPVLVDALGLFNGTSTELDLNELLYRATSDLESGRIAAHLMETLSSAGFLHDENFETLREARQRDFREQPERLPVHAGSAYPDTEPELRELMDGYFAEAGEGKIARDGLVGLAAPHVSPDGGWESYRDAYRYLGPDYRDRTFVVLGTSHYGAPQKFGLTRKPYVTPFGTARTAIDLVNQLESAAPDAVVMEDYCHAMEHSIEFQVAFLQSVCGAGIRILPILCGPFAKSIYQSGAPEDDEGVARFLDALAELRAREGKKLCWVLGVDMAHIGARYGDGFEAQPHLGEMAQVEERDRARIAQINASSAGGFWDLVQQNHDDLKWCGSSPFYTFLKVFPKVRGELQRYQQWAIDPQSVVSFAGITFHDPS